MKQIQNISLKEYNTFNIDVNALYSFFCESESDVIDILEFCKKEKKKIFVLGSGSNVLFTEDINDFILLMRMKGITLLDEDEKFVFVKVSSGEIWDDFVSWCVNRNYGGIENLSLIPGTAGASPIQNIGAYGVEVKDVIQEVEAIHKQTLKKRVFKNTDCKFAYRNSIFKNELKNQYIILNVTFKLSKTPELKLSYGNLQNEIRKKNPSIKDVRETVIRIRESKLPKPENLPNAGSFFKNPIIPKEQFKNLKNKFPELVSYPASDKSIKLAAGQLIDLCGFKGAAENGVGVHKEQALVIVNYDNADGKTILRFSEKIQKSVFKKFGVSIEREVLVYP